MAKDKKRMVPMATTREKKRALQKEVDGVLLLADTHVGLASEPSPYVPGRHPTNGQYVPAGHRDNGKPISKTAVGLTPTEYNPAGPQAGISVRQNEVGGWAPERPVAEPDPKSIPPLDPRKKNGTASFGVSGTPITGGFLLDLGEYNPDLYGRNAVMMYEKMRRGDAMVWATLRAAKQPQWSATWEVIPGVKANDPGFKQAEEVADFVRDNLFGGLETETSMGSVDSQPFHSVLYNALLMLDFGCAIHEDIYTLDGNDVRLRSLAGRLPLTFYRWHTEEDGETLIGVEQYGYRGNNFQNVTVPANKLCRFTYNQEGANFWGIAMLRPMYPHWHIVNSLYRVDALAGERNGMGIPVITLAEGFSTQDRATAFRMVTQLAVHEMTGIVLAPGQTFKLEAVQGQVRDVMKSIEHHKRQMSFSALQHFLTIGSAPHGSRATSSTQHGFFIAASKHLAEQVSQAITASTIRRLVRYNFGPDTSVPKLVVKNIKSEDFSNIVGMLTELAGSGLVVSDQGLRDYIRLQQDLPKETKDGILSIKGESIDEGAASGVVAGKGGGTITQGGKQPKQPGQDQPANLEDTAKGKGIAKSKAAQEQQALLAEMGKKTNLGASGRKKHVFLTGEQFLGEVGVDFDGVLVERNDDMDSCVPIEKGLRIVRSLQEAGYVPVIFTARTDTVPVEQFLEDNDLGSLEITNVKRPSFVAMIDDRAIHNSHSVGDILAKVRGLIQTEATADRSPENHVTDGRAVITQMTELYRAAIIPDAHAMVGKTITTKTLDVVSLDKSDVDALPANAVGIVILATDTSRVVCNGDSVALLKGTKIQFLGCQWNGKGRQWLTAKIV